MHRSIKKILLISPFNFNMMIRIIRVIVIRVILICYNVFNFFMDEFVETMLIAFIGELIRRNKINSSIY